MKTDEEIKEEYRSVERTLSEYLKAPGKNDEHHLGMFEGRLRTLKWMLNEGSEVKLQPDKTVSKMVCPNCGAILHVLPVSWREGKTGYRCVSCTKTWVLSNEDVLYEVR